MDFGKVNNLDEVDFSLPSDHPITEQLFKKLKPGKQPEVYVGCAKWGREDWIGKLYPKGTKAKDFLFHYVQNFNSIELNALFYNLQPKNVIDRWASLAKDDFRFCPKFSNSITHLRQLKNAEAATDRFIDHMLSFGHKLGHSFLQLSERFGPKRADVVHEYLRKLPRDFKTSIEFRHPDWFGKDRVIDETFELLHELGVSTVITDTAGRRDCLHMKLTTPVAFIRYVGNNNHPTDFTRIDTWVTRIKEWMDSGIQQVYFFIHNQDEPKSPGLCKYAIEQLNKKANTNLKLPQLLN